jgi:hypothetical protein
MKTLDTKWMLKVAGVAILSSVMITGCGGGSKKPNPVDPPPVEEPDPVLPPEVGDDIAQVISGSVIKASDGSIIDGALVKFLENGAAATNIADVDGNVITSITAAEGSFEVTIKEGATIDQFTIVASAEGFIEKSTVVDVIADADVISAQVELTANAGVGVATIEKEATVENAVAAADIIVDTDDNVADPSEDTTVGSATVAVPAATQLQDAAGNPVTGTAVKVAVTFVEETDDQQANAAEATTVAAAIPAGLNEVEEVAEVSIPLAVAQVNVTATDTATNTTTEVKKFSAPITITFNLPATTKVRSADRLVQEGDQFTVKSFDEDEGIWKVEPNKAIVGAEGARGFPATLAVDHLTFFAVTDGVAACNQDINISLTGDAIPAAGLSVRLFSSDLNTYGVFRPGDESYTIPAAVAKSVGIAANATAAMRVRDFEGNVWGETDGEVAFCGDVTLALTNPVETVDENLTITAVCSNDTTVTAALTGALVKYRLDATKPYRVAPGNGDGTYTLSALVSGSDYSVVVDTNLAAVTELQTTTVTADGTGESLDVSLTCAGGTGTGGSGGSGGTGG